jgi:sugar phosphate isomerase/epimerase
MIFVNMKFSRRDFARLAVSAAPLARAFGKMIDSKINGVQLGVQTYSFRDLSLDDAIKAMAADGLGDCELFSQHLEPGGAKEAVSFWEGPARPEAELKAYEQKTRKWRMSVPLDYFKGIRKKFDDAGINIYGFNLSPEDGWSEAEIDRGFLMAKALGVGLITSSTTVTTAKRMAPLAEKHNMMVAMHGHSDLKDPNQFATPESFAKALAMSKHFRINLDIGHFTAANFDAVDYIRKNHEKIVLLHLKDRKKNDGANTPWGEGDTPIKQVLQLLKANKYPIPAFIEYEYKGAGTSQQEVAKCYQYCKEALA